MNAYAAAVRRGTLEAARVLKTLELSAETIDISGRIDVMKIAALKGLEVIFRPLDGLLGAYYGGPTPGALVTTNRPLTVQRFTGAHEFGHHWLGHKPSLDDDSILRRDPFDAASGGDLQEVEANAFAAALLLPRWLVTWHCNRQGWLDADLRKPEVVYQLALRTGTSYEATCWILYRYNVISRTIASKLTDIAPREIKKNLLKTFIPDQYYGDVWLLTARDAGAKLEGSSRDIFIICLRENSGAGYVWALSGFESQAFPVVADERRSLGREDECGGPVVRRITAESRAQQAGELQLREERPWQPAKPLHVFVLGYDLSGPEQRGLSRAERRLRLEAVA